MYCILKTSEGNGRKKLPKSLRDGNYLIFKDAPKIETIKAGLKYIDINVLRRFSVILHCNGISSHFNIRRSLSSDSYINKSTAKHFTNETFVYLLVRICLYPRVHENTSKSNLNPSGFFYFRLHTVPFLTSVAMVSPSSPHD